MNQSALDHKHMSRAIQLARRGLYTTQPNPRVGCVIARDEQVIAEGYHLQAGGPHAEIVALQQAGAQAAGATAYVSLEPCSHHGKTPPCADALIDAGLARVVCAMQDPNPLVAGQGLEKLRQAGIEVECGVLQADAEVINPGFIKRMRSGLPYVRAKLAMSLDGRTAMASGESQWITGEAARSDVQRLRARSSVVLTGSGTVIADNPQMNVRLDAQQLGLDCAPHQPLRAVIDSELKSPATSQIFTQADGMASTVVFTHQHYTADCGFAEEQLVTLPRGADKLHLREVLRYLAELQANEVHVEAGSELCGALLEQKLLDEIVIYMAPHIMGNAARGLFHLPGLASMAERISLDITQVRAVGTDWRITARPVYPQQN